MKLYYHHVGQVGSEKDFKKTIFSRIPISLIENSIPDSNPHKQLLITEAGMVHKYVDKIE